jgi:rhodanese-related sulfurtransferase
MTVADLKTKLDAKEPIFLLDVRTPAEFSQDGHVAAATLIPLDKLDSRLSELPTDTPIACICRSGNRSTTACTDLAARGYDVTNVTGGMHAWSAAGFPITRP